jgi:putative ABC transport system permease protein
MIKFLIKGVFRDRQRSLIPILIVTIGVFLTVLMHCWITGIIGDFVEFNANYVSGHVKVMSRAYADKEDQIPNDLALIGANAIISELDNESPGMEWVQRIRFGGLIDVPDEFGETKSQGPSIGLAIDLLGENSSEVQRMNIANSLAKGGMPQNPNEILISDEFANKLQVHPDDTVTLMGSTMYGSMVFHNFKIAGTIQFGIAVMDRGSIIIDINDAQIAFDMQDTAGEILGYFPDNLYHDESAELMKSKFNQKYSQNDDPFAPVMLKLRDDNDLSSMMDYVSQMVGFFMFIFVSAMSIVLWNTGLIGGLRRYSEVGVRLAIGEYKGHIYRSMIWESVFNGIIGSVIGTAIGLTLGYIIQEIGIDFSEFLKSSTMMMPTKYRTAVTPTAYYIGFIPGLFSTVLGTMLSGIGIYRRQTAQLFKELEA